MIIENNSCSFYILIKSPQGVLSNLIISRPYPQTPSHHGAQWPNLIFSIHPSIWCKNVHHGTVCSLIKSFNTPDVLFVYSSDYICTHTHILFWSWNTVSVFLEVLLLDCNPQIGPNKNISNIFRDLSSFHWQYKYTANIDVHLQDILHRIMQLYMAIPSGQWTWFSLVLSNCV